MLKTYKKFKFSITNDLAMMEGLLKFTNMCNDVEKIRENLHGGIHTYIHYLTMEMDYKNLEILIFTRSNILLCTKYIKVVML